LFWVEFFWFLAGCLLCRCLSILDCCHFDINALAYGSIFFLSCSFVCLFAANVFGTLKKQTGFTPYVGAEGFKLEIPSKWNPSREVEFPGQVLRYEDNFDATNNLSVSITPSSKSSIKDYGSPEDFLASVSSPPEL
jgi:hypothetical protein